MSESYFTNPTPMELGLEADFRSRSKTSEAQAAAFERFTKLGFPNRKVEGWKWSDFNAVMRSFQPKGEALSQSAIAPSPFAALNPLEFRIVNGRVELPAEEMPQGLRYGVMDPVGTIPELENHPMAALNVAMTRKALGIEVCEGVAYDRPILFRHINSSAGFTFVQTLLRMSIGAKATLIETYEGEGAGFYSQLFHLVVRDGAKLDRILLQDGHSGTKLHTIAAAKMEKDAHLNMTGLSTGGRLSRHESHIHFWEKDATTSIDTAALVSGDSHSDFTSEVIFKNQHCQARQVHKGVARGRSRNVFQGKFNVERAAQKTDARMTANALLLSDEAEANHKPELEIYADDVECAHGSTAGALDEDALFYLRQRGLDEQQARAILIEAFLGEVIDGIENETVREVFRKRAQDWLEEAA